MRRAAVKKTERHMTFLVNIWYIGFFLVSNDENVLVLA